MQGGRRPAVQMGMLLAAGLALLLAASGCAERSAPPQQQPEARAEAPPSAPPVATLRVAYASTGLSQAYVWLAQEAGYFAEEGLEVELVYARGGSQALQFLVGRAVDYAATSLDAALQAYQQGAPILRFCSTGRLPLFALAAAPKSPVKGLKDLEGKTVGISALGNADHVLLVYLLRKAGADPKRVQYATLGPNLYEALKAGHVEAGMVQEPALTLLFDRLERHLLRWRPRGRAGGEA